MKIQKRRYELTDDEWERICSLFPVRGAGTKGRPYNDIRTTVNGIIWLARSGAPWWMVTYNNGRFIILLYLFRQRRMGRQVIITELCRGREGADCFFGYEPPSFPQEKRLRLPA